jgi:ubiquitin-conjugating enzyme E2 R
MLSDPNFSSPANVDASVELRKDPQSYKARVRKIVEKSKAELPVGFEMPKAKPLPKLQESVSDLLDDDDFAAYVRVFRSAGACV